MMQVHHHAGRSRRSRSGRSRRRSRSRYYGTSHNCPFDSASAVEFGIGGLEQLGWLVMLIGE